MKNLLPDYILFALKELKSAVQRDSYDLTQDDHDSILAKIDLLEKYIKEKYERRMHK